MVGFQLCRFLALSQFAIVTHADRHETLDTVLSSETSQSDVSDVRTGKRRKVRRYPVLCDHEIVASTCEAININTVEYFHTAADKDRSILHAHELADQLSVSTDEVVAFLKRIKAENVEDEAAALQQSAFAVKCHDLCIMTVASIPNNLRPPSSDVGCIVTDKHQQKPTCDIDLSDATMDAIKFADRGEKTSEKIFAEKRRAHRAEKAKAKPIAHEREQRAATKSGAERAKPKQEVVDGSLMRRAVANLFRIYPAVGSTMRDRLDDQNVRAELAAADQIPKAKKLPKAKLSSLVEGPSYSAPNEKGCVDKIKSGYEYEDSGEDYPCSELASEGSCDEDDETMKENCAKSCGFICSPPEPPVPGDWKYDVLKISVKAQAYTARALRKMAAKQVPHRVTQWFGNNENPTRKEIKRVLNGVSGMLANVEYVFPGEDCEGDTFAYVYPQPPDNVNNRGNYIYYLCPLYMEVTEDVQIETLTHEGSHHEAMLADDVCAPDVENPGEDNANCEDNKAYGRGRCMDLAKQFPERAIKNADTFCFFVNDVNEAPYTGGCVDKEGSGIFLGDEAIEPPCGPRVKEYCNDEAVGSVVRSHCPATCRLSCGGNQGEASTPTEASPTIVGTPGTTGSATTLPPEQLEVTKSISVRFAPGCCVIAAVMLSRFF